MRSAGIRLAPVSSVNLMAEGKTTENTITALASLSVFWSEAKMLPVLCSCRQLKASRRDGN